ncbi:5-methylthioadenosine/S-adenosylhomocysteine deaminase [Fibrobacter sp. UWCM]|uniref:amidohydrolase n=1 Tax=Fibrobacter sp. UWCM TaxID=1896208 RepID=UPI0009158360|nr:amidohydrolase [Fibrobacter sp. UWCM]SHG62083.1 5-methylthioadenosine/S-adenosylhomocysteine deaminase [Fibrobacter sp. UWCM]
MHKILLKSVVLPGQGCGKVVDVLIAGNRFARIGVVPPEESLGAEVVDCSRFAIFPAFYNGHTHAAMTLLRGYADDMPLQKWLQEYIWPFEAKLTGDDIDVACRLALLEMIKSGTVFFADMYWHRERTIKVVGEMGIRAAVGVTFAESLMSPEAIEGNFKFLAAHTGESERVRLAVAPHSVYTVGETLLKRCADFARSENFMVHTHLSETKKELEDCERQYGCSPVRLLERAGMLGSNLAAAHCVHLSDDDMKAFVDSGATAVLNPNSNLKLASGIPPIDRLLRSGANVALGTDGDSSNNNLDMHEEMKLAALLAKVQGGAETLPAHEALKMATVHVARAYGLMDAGEIKEGYLADCLLVDLKNERMVPGHNLVSNWVYAADSSCIDSVICNGKFVMRGRHVDGEEEIVREAETCAKRLAAV